MGLKRKPISGDDPNSKRRYFAAMQNAGAFCVSEVMKIEEKNCTLPTRWRDVPIPCRCHGCPYPRVGFICYDSKRDTCLRTDMEAIEAQHFQSKNKA